MNKYTGTGSDEMDREKVIKALECRKNADKRCGNPCEETGMCHYATAVRGLDGEIYKPFVCDRERICTDALALIDTQYKLILELQNLISIGTKMMNGGEVGMNLADFRKDRNGVPYKCKYHCDYGDGEFCHYKENKENGCVLNKSQDDEIKGRRMSDAESIGMLFDDAPDISVDAFIKWCANCHMMGDATLRGIKYWVGKYKEQL